MDIERQRNAGALGQRPRLRDCGVEAAVRALVELVLGARNDLGNLESTSVWRRANSDVAFHARDATRISGKVT